MYGYGQSCGVGRTCYQNWLEFKAAAIVKVGKIGRSVSIEEVDSEVLGNQMALNNYSNKIPNR